MQRVVRIQQCEPSSLNFTIGVKNLSLRMPEQHSKLPTVYSFRQIEDFLRRFPENSANIHAGLYQYFATFRLEPRHNVQPHFTAQRTVENSKQQHQPTVIPTYERLKSTEVTLPIMQNSLFPVYC